MTIESIKCELLLTMQCSYRQRLPIYLELQYNSYNSIYSYNLYNITNTIQYTVTASALTLSRNPFNYSVLNRLPSLVFTLHFWSRESFIIN